jgi:MFS family permease
LHVTPSERSGPIWRNREFALLWAAQAISQTAQNALWYGILVLVQHKSNSNTHLSLAIMTLIVPSVLFGVIAGVYVDRWDKRLVLTGRGRLPLLDAGAALIDTTYVDNAASAIVAALHRMEHVHGRALVVSNGEPRPVGELLAGICAAGGVPAPSWTVPGGVARAAGAVVEKLWTWAGRKEEPPMTRFLAEQLSTAHWFDQRETRDLLDWTPAVSLDDGLARLAEHYSTRSAVRVHRS